MTNVDPIRRQISGEFGHRTEAIERDRLQAFRERKSSTDLSFSTPTRKMNLHLRREFALVVYATSLAGHRPSPLFTQQDVGERGTEAQTPAQIGVIVSDSNNRAACYISS